MPKIIFEFEQQEMAEIDELLYAGAFKSTLRFFFEEVRNRIKYGEVSEEVEKELEGLRKKVREHLCEEIPDGLEMVMR